MRFTHMFPLYSMIFYVFSLRSLLTSPTFHCFHSKAPSDRHSTSDSVAEVILDALQVLRGAVLLAVALAPHLELRDAARHGVVQLELPRHALHVLVRLDLAHELATLHLADPQVRILDV